MFYTLSSIFGNHSDHTSTLLVVYILLMLYEKANYFFLIKKRKPI